MSLAMSLAAISADFSQNRDRMSRACLATLCELGMYLVFFFLLLFVAFLLIIVLLKLLLSSFLFAFTCSVQYQVLRLYFH